MGSSTYAQLLIVVCVVAAMSEVVTHNVSFLYFEVFSSVSPSIGENDNNLLFWDFLQGFFAYLYTVSILFFLYVFGYLLRSKRRREEKRRLRKLNKPPIVTAPKQESVIKDGLRSRSTSVVCLENELGSNRSPLNRFVSSIRNQERRRLSLALPGTDASPPPHHPPLQWSPSSVSFSLMDESPSDAVSYAMNSDNVIASSTNSGRSKIKKMKVSDNDHSHGSFFLRAGAVGPYLSDVITVLHNSNIYFI